MNNLLKEKCMMYNYGYIDNDNIAHEHVYDKVHLNNLLKEKCMMYNYGYIGNDNIAHEHTLTY